MGPRVAIRTTTLPNWRGSRSGPCIRCRIGHAGDGTRTLDRSTAMKRLSLRDRVISFLTGVLLVATGCLVLVLVTLLPLPEWFKVPVTVVGIVALRVIAASMPLEL